MSSKKLKKDTKKLSIKQLEKKLYNFLEKYKVKGSGVKHTHTAFGPPWGKFDIPDDNMKEFYSMYKKLVGKTDLHITERPREVGPILVDIDWNSDKDHGDRQYTDEHIKLTITRYAKVLKKYFKVTKKQLRAFVFQKEKPTKKINKAGNFVCYKDGFHIIFPYFPASIGMRYLVRDEVIELIKKDDIYDDLEYTNSLDDVIDGSIIESNGWMMFGSRKHDGYLYNLSDVYNYDLTKDNTDKYSNSECIDILGNRNYGDDEERELNPKRNKNNVKERVEKVLMENSAQYRKRKKEEILKARKDAKNAIKNDVDELSDNEDNDANYVIKKKNYSSKNDIGLAVRLVEILDHERAMDYHKWISVCWALKTISKDLFDVFDSFSQRGNYDKYGVRNAWDNARDEGYTIRALHRWARHDNPEKYKDIIREGISHLITEAENGTEYDIAKVIFEMYKDRYVCSSIKHSVWYEFQTHRWVEVEAGYTLKNKMSEELVQEFAMLIANYYTQISATTGSSKDDLLRRAENIQKVMTKLRRSSFKKSVLEECASLFFDPNFEEQLDGNRDIIGFNNGVYDLKERRFRDGVPEDYLTLSVGYDWEDYDESHEHVEKIEQLFSRMMREDTMKDYILTLLASYLDGHTKRQKVIIWTGIGSNGKSVTINFFEMAFGEYCGVLPITVLTRKQGGSSNATPEMADTRGKRFVVFQEPENDDKIYVGRMKELSGSDWIYARPLFRDPIRFKPQFKLVMTCNKLPHIDSTDGGTWRRLRVTPWESEFVDLDKKGLFYGKKLKPYQFPKDYEIYDKLEEWKKVFMWLLVTKYYVKYKDEGLYEPEKVLAFTNKYKKDSDIYHEYLDENLVKTNNDKDYESVDAIFSGFKFWYRESYANNKCPSKKELRDYMENHDYKLYKGYIKGIRFTNDEDVQDELDG